MGYSIRIAADMLVRKNVQLGLSRHLNRKLAKSKVASVMTAVAHKSALVQYGKWLLKNCDGKHLKNSKVGDARRYLLHRAETKKQSTLDLCRQAINLHLHSDEPLEHVASMVPTVQMDRGYSESQIALLVKRAEPELALSILLAAEAGLRDMELISLAPEHVLRPSNRDWNPDLFCGRTSDQTFSVWGKGGLCRSIKLSSQLAIQIADKAYPEPLIRKNRQANLTSYFDLIGGQTFSILFGRLSKRVLGFSHGSHGLRHSFAQRRRTELLCLGFSPEEAIDVVSQELGHFSQKNTKAYLRDIPLTSKQ